MTRSLSLGLLVLSVVMASCSAGFSRPRAVSLVEGDGIMYALVDPDRDRNTDTNIDPLQATTDGRTWEPIVGDRSLPATVGVELNQPGVAQECDEVSGRCYRILAPDGGISLEESTDRGQTFTPIWDITAGRLDFQDRCCGSRQFAIRDLEFDPGSGIVAVALGEYGLLTRDVDGAFHLDTLGRPERPESGFLTGLFVEPLFAGVVALIIGWITTEQRLTRVRRELELRFGSADHTWLTDRARQVPIILPLVFFVGLAGVAAAFWRVTRTAEGDPWQANGWVSLGFAIALIAAVAIANHVLLTRQWRADEQTQARAHFAPAKRRAVRAQLIGSASAVISYGVTMAALVLWSTGGIDAFDDAIKLAMAGAVLTGAAFWIWEASRPPLPD
ncbi:MAG: hypothetical protein HKN74_08275 [Acidimicrobiia bacterium]|nr:hypothetical protein [Acidimicrobiia bacterium]NNF10264.1 hypothetical protein [Acidimicrobiia bacterium]NNL69271.1 hypothetical protein [Acidimicrobiia bacterium]